MKISLLFLSVATAFLTATTSFAGMAAEMEQHPAATHNPVDEDIFPPWQNGSNNDAVKRGLNFTVPEVDNLPDFHGDPLHPALVLYVGGNYFFAMAPLIEAFEKDYPDYKGHIYWETLPPGRLIQQIEAGGTITVGNMTWTVQPDVYLAGLSAVTQHIGTGLLEAPAVPYVTNTLAIMIPADNPAHITSLADLGRPDIKIAMPDPAYEGIAHQIKTALSHAGGEKLVRDVYTEKVAQNTTLLTRIHHRQTPLWIMQGKVQAGVTWQSEVMFQQKAGHPVAGITIPEDQNATAIYAGAMVKGAPHPQAAQRWLAFTVASGPEHFRTLWFQTI